MTIVDSNLGDLVRCRTFTENGPDFELVVLDTSMTLSLSPELTMDVCKILESIHQ